MFTGKGGRGGRLSHISINQWVHTGSKGIGSRMNPAGAVVMGKEGVREAGVLTTDVWLELRLHNKPFSHYSERKQSGWPPDSSAVQLFHDTSEGLGGKAFPARRRASPLRRPPVFLKPEVLPPSFRNKEISGQLLKRFKTSK